MRKFLPINKLSISGLKLSKPAFSIASKTSFTVILDLFLLLHISYALKVNLIFYRFEIYKIKTPPILLKAIFVFLLNNTSSSKLFFIISETTVIGKSI